MKKYIAEFIGTFCLVLFGCGAAVLAGGSIPDALSGLGILGVSLAFGLSVVVMAYAIGGISGCHINPAISISMLVAGKLSVGDTIGYVVSQCLGAIAASALLYLFMQGHVDANGAEAYTELGEYALGSNGWGGAYLGKFGTTTAFVTEFIMTFLFLFVIFATTSRFGNATMAGLAIGLALVLIHMVAIPITGTSVNPARSLGPALFAGGAAIKQLWLFFAAPIAGGVTAAIVWRFVFEPEHVKNNAAVSAQATV